MALATAGLLAGVTNDVWLQVRRTEGNVQWASAVYFVGNQYADTPADAVCPDSPAPAQG